MKKPSRAIANSFLLSLLFAVVLVVPFSGVASARQGSDDQNNVAVSSDSQQSEPEQRDDNLSDDKASVRLKIEKLRAEAKTEIEVKRKNGETLSADKRMKVCENRKTAINNKLSAFNTAADKHFTKLNSINDKIVAFQEKKQVVLANQAELEADITAKKQAASEAIAALKAIAVDVDCSDPETAVTLGAVRDAAHNARAALHEYRVELKNLVVAIGQTQSDTSNDDKKSSDSTAETAEGTN